MTDQRGTLAWQARYAVWGNTIMEQWSQEHRPDATGMSPSNPLPQNLRMQGQYYDVETGLCYNTFRYYDADVGRFVSPDPIGLAGGMNLYQYAPNPFSWIDPWGWSAYSGVDFTGQKVFYPVAKGQYNEVQIPMQGSRGRDFTAANNAAGIKGGTPKGYTWHHVNDFNSKNGMTTMQLVTTKAHEASFPHSGSVSQFEKHFKLFKRQDKYGSKKARAIVAKKGWRVGPGCEA